MANDAALAEAVAMLTAPPPAHLVEPGHANALHVAAEENDVGALRLAMARPGALVDELDHQMQYTPAIHAAVNDSIEALVLLRDAGADLDKAGRRGVTPVFAAAASGAVRALEILIQAGVELDTECDDETALEWLGLPCETGSAYGSRLHGDRLVAAQMLVLAGAYVEAGIIVHRPSRDILHTWATSELEAAAAFHTVVMGLYHGMADAYTSCAFGKLAGVDGVPQRVASYLVRRTRRELQRLARAAWVWRDEADDERFRAETRAFPRANQCIECF